MRALLFSLAGSIVLAAPTAAAHGSAPVKTALAAAYARLDAAYNRRDLPGLRAFRSPTFVQPDIDPTDGTRMEGHLAGVFKDATTLNVATRVLSVVLVPGGAAATVARRFTITVPGPPPGMPMPLVQIDANVETWERTPAGWRMTRMKDTPVRRELKQMAKADQAVRMALIHDPKNTRLASRMAAIDAKDTARMKQIVATYGWPGHAIAGTDGAGDAWLLVQHADADLPFQKRCLVLLQAAVARGEADKGNLAYLTDRVRVAEHKPQVYGTQFRTDSHGALVPQPIEDAADVDKRRTAVGLPPMAEYAKQMQQVYHQDAQARPPGGG